jgi:co-chaperonin GroES (HSP10)
MMKTEDAFELPPLRTMTNVEAASQPDEHKPKQLPDPSGYRILCAVPDVEDRFESGLFKADVTKHYEELLATVLFVLKVGPDAYKDPTRFPSGPWCKEGDFVIVRPHAGTRIKIHGKEFRLLNDDSIEAVVEDPRGIKRA